MPAVLRASARTISFAVFLIACQPSVAQNTALMTSPLPVSPEPAAAAASGGGETRVPVSLRDVFGNTVAAHRLEQSLAPYLTVAGTDGTLLAPLPAFSGKRQAYSLGADMIVLTSGPISEDVSVTLPPGHWVNFWTGAQSMGGSPFTAELPAGTLPIWVRGGSVIERRSGGYDGYFEKRLTDDAKACGEQCLIDVMPAFGDGGPAAIKDADGRTLTRSSSGLAVEGKAARMTVRWRFTGVSDVRVNGRAVHVQSSPEGYYASFDHADQTTVEWTVRKYMPRSY